MEKSSHPSPDGRGVHGLEHLQRLVPLLLVVAPRTGLPSDRQRLDVLQDRVVGVDVAVRAARLAIGDDVDPGRLHVVDRGADGIVEHLVEIAGRAPAIEPSEIRQIGIRSVDAGEKRFVHELGFEVYDMRYIDEMGMRHTMELALATLDANTHLHVSFDVDFLDPSIAPGVGTTVPGGPNYREAQLVMEMIADTGLMGSLDIVELNPVLDRRNRTAKLTVDLVESLFGKSTLMRD